METDDRPLATGATAGGDERRLRGITATAAVLQAKSPAAAPARASR